MLGLKYTQPGGIRALTGKWDLAGPGQTDEASDTITGSGGNAQSETVPGNTFTYGDSEHTVKDVPDDNTIILTSAWGGPSGKGAEVYVSGLKPDPATVAALAKSKGGGVTSGGAPIWKSPIFIASVLAVAVIVTVVVIRMRKKKKNAKR